MRGTSDIKGRLLVAFSAMACAWGLALPQALAQETPSRPGSSFASDDFDLDGLINADEALVGSLPDVEDTDGDDLLDGEEAVPLNPVMRVPAAPETSYALIDLGEIPNAVGVNDRGDVLLLGQGSDVNLQYGWLWRNGNTLYIGEGVSGTFRGPLFDGSVYYATQEEEDTIVDSYGTGNRTMSMDNRWHPSSPGSSVSVGPYSETTSWTGIPQTGFVSDPPTLTLLGQTNQGGYAGGWSAMAAAIPGSLPPGFLFDTNRPQPASSTARVTLINDYHDRFLTLTAWSSAGYIQSGEIPSSVASYGQIVLSGWQSNPDFYSTVTGYWAVNNAQGPNVQQSKQIIFANAELITVAKGYAGNFFVRFPGGSFTEVPGATQITDMNSQTTAEGPYFFGTKGTQGPTLWCLNSGAFESYRLRDVSNLPQGQEGVVSRKISKNLVIPMGGEIWRNSIIRSIDDLCRSSTGQFNSPYATHISPNGRFMIASASNVNTDNDHALLLLPFELKVSSANSPTGSAPKYTVTPETPKKGNADNLFSVWLGEDFTVKVKLPESFQLPPNLIKWNAPGENIPDNTKEHTFNWTAVGTKRIEVQVGESTFEIWVDVPHVGDVGQFHAMATIPPWATAQIGSWGTFAQNYCNTHYPESPKRDAIRHSYWCALSVSDGYVTQDQVLYFTTAHEHDDKWTDKEQSFNTTMDLWNNFTGSTVDISVPTLPPTPNTNLILHALEQKYSAGELWIFDGNSSQGASEGIILKSDGLKIHPIN
jgi:hypothetical protein